MNPGEDRMAFSVEWTLSPEGKVLEEWFGRSVIRSCVKLAYEHAQDMITSPPERAWKEDELPPITGPFGSATIAEKVRQLQSLATKMRAARVEAGALRLDAPKLTFGLDRETGEPQALQLYEQKESNRLVEEFMLLANTRVAMKITDAFPDLALLRRHPKPKPAVMARTLGLLSEHGITFDASTSKTLADSLRQYATASNARKYVIMVSLCSKAMELARYFCAGAGGPPDVPAEEFRRHYALSVPLYTHFTSPIRRYPDVIVHRLLQAALEGERLEGMSVAGASAAAEVCNAKKLAAKAASDDSAGLYLGLFIRQSGPLREKAMVVNVLDHSVDCLVFAFADTKRVYMDKLEPACAGPPRFSKKRAGKSGEMLLHWKPAAEGGQPRPQVLRMFTEVTVTLTAAGEDRPFDYLAVIEPPD